MTWIPTHMSHWAADHGGVCTGCRLGKGLSLDEGVCGERGGGEGGHLVLKNQRIQSGEYRIQSGTGDQ